MHPSEARLRGATYRTVRLYVRVETKSAVILLRLLEHTSVARNIKKGEEILFDYGEDYWNGKKKTSGVDHGAVVE